MDRFWQQIYFGNSMEDWITAICIIVSGFTLLRLIKKAILIKLRKWTRSTTTSIDDFILAGLERSGFPLLYIVVVYTALNFLLIPEKVMHKISAAIWVTVMFFILRTVTAGVKYFILAAIRQKDNSQSREKQAAGLIVILNVSIWIVGFIFLLDNLGYNMGTLIAGLGIGGIAIALAAQTILGDLFSYFVIFFDRPFEVGDSIAVDDKVGTIEYIGVKTTRLRTLGGEQLICSNKDLTNSRVHNYGRMQKRRVLFKIGVIYQTPAEKLKKIAGMVKSIIESHKDVEFDRGHFVSFGDSSLNFEFVYFLLKADHALYMNIHQAILMTIFETFEKEQIEFAYPTQTLFIQGEPPANNGKLSSSGKEALTKN